MLLVEPQDRMGGMLDVVWLVVVPSLLFGTCCCRPAQYKAWTMVANSQNTAALGSAHPRTLHASVIQRV